MTFLWINNRTNPEYESKFYHWLASSGITQGNIVFYMYAVGAYGLLRDGVLVTCLNILCIDTSWYVCTLSANNQIHCHALETNILNLETSISPLIVNKGEGYFSDTTALQGLYKTVLVFVITTFQKENC
jgi:hypothetical protein